MIEKCKCKLLTYSYCWPLGAESWVLSTWRIVQEQSWQAAESHHVPAHHPGRYHGHSLPHRRSASSLHTLTLTLRHNWQLSQWSFKRTFANIVVVHTTYNHKEDQTYRKIGNYLDKLWWLLGAFASLANDKTTFGLDKQWESMGLALVLTRPGEGPSLGLPRDHATSSSLRIVWSFILQAAKP